ncbi:MAG: S8 family serine peptidase [Epsilonproteobacteria bacterium]|nr:S8 family serine peptidase [Campylobacterota bacterium]
MNRRLWLYSTIAPLLLLSACGSTSDGDQNNTIEDEPYYKYAWHFEYNSDFGRAYGIDSEAHLHIKEAWKITKGEDVTVAVIDPSSFEATHEDLQANVLSTYNADTKTTDVSNKTDTTSHGSTVAGFIASPINGKGLVGAAPNAKLLLIQSEGSDASTIEAFEYAKNNGAQVINCSWGTNNVSDLVANYFQELKDAGITIIFASGNEGCNMDRNYEAVIQNDELAFVCRDRIGSPINDESELSSVIGIGGTNEWNDVTSYSNYGSNIDLLAPAGDLSISSGILGIDDTGSLGSEYQFNLVSNRYAFTHGTSFAAPLTTGVVALMLSVNPNLTPDQIREILIQTADKVGSFATYNSAGFDTYRAYGKLNATKAVEAAQSYSQQ